MLSSAAMARPVLPCARSFADIIAVGVECRLPPKLDSASFRGSETGIDAFDDDRTLELSEDG